MEFILSFINLLSGKYNTPSHATKHWCLGTHNGKAHNEVKTSHNVRRRICQCEGVKKPYPDCIPTS